MGGDGALQSLGSTEQALHMPSFQRWCPSASCQHPQLYWLLLMGLAEGFGGVCLGVVVERGLRCRRNE